MTISPRSSIFAEMPRSSLASPEPVAESPPLLGDLLRQLAQDMKADAILLGIDLGHGYRFEHYQPADALPIKLSQSLLASPQGCHIHSRPLSAGSPRRRHMPRSQIAAIRILARGNFGRSAHRHLDSQLPHLDHAIVLTHELESCRQREKSACALLADISPGCVLLAADGSIVYHDDHALALLMASGIVPGHTLVLPRRSLQQRYDALLARLAREVPGTRHTLDIAAAPPLRLCLRSLESAPNLIAMMVEHSAGRRPELSPVFAVRYGLTPCEFKLCGALAAGMTLKQCACLWNRSYETLRGQLKEIFSKTGCNRQANLIALLLNHTG